MYQQAIDALKKAVALDPLQEMELDYAFARAGNRVEAEKILEEFLERSRTERVDPANMALIYIGLGDKEKAFDWLDKAFQERSSWMTWLKVEPKYDPIRKDPRFNNLIRRVGLPL